MASNVEFSKRGLMLADVMSQRTPEREAAERISQAEGVLRDGYHVLLIHESPKRVIKQARRVLDELNDLQDMLDRMV